MLQRRSLLVWVQYTSYSRILNELVGYSTQKQKERALNQWINFTAKHVISHSRVEIARGYCRAHAFQNTMLKWREIVRIENKLETSEQTLRRKCQVVTKRQGFTWWRQLVVIKKHSEYKENLSLEFLSDIVLRKFYRRWMHQYRSRRLLSCRALDLLAVRHRRQASRLFDHWQRRVFDRRVRRVEEAHVLEEVRMARLCTYFDAWVRLYAVEVINETRETRVRSMRFSTRKNTTSRTSTLTNYR
eukprot:474866_1